MRRPFISYAREDYDTAVRLHDDLRRAGMTPWLDRETIRAGEDWRAAIREGLRTATHVIALISRHSVNKRGFVQKELGQALELAEEMPPGEIYIIPVRLDPIATNHERLNDLHRVDLFEGYESGLERILEGLRATSSSAVSPIAEPNVDLAAALMAHEVANTLGIFNVYLNIIRDEAGDLDRVAQSVDVLERSVSRTLSFMREVRSLSSRQHVTEEQLDVKQWLLEIEPELRGTAGTGVSFELRTSDPGLTIRTANRDALTHAMINLVKNARQATGDTGSIIVAAKVASNTQGRSVCLSVADTGQGIESKQLSHIFEPFFTTKKQGSGIGLWLVQNIVHAHGGRVVVQSDGGKGATFLICLPLTEVAKEER